MADPPTVKRVRKMAELLDEDVDELIAMAGRLPEDLPELPSPRSLSSPVTYSSCEVTFGNCRSMGQPSF